MPPTVGALATLGSRLGRRMPRAGRGDPNGSYPPVFPGLVGYGGCGADLLDKQVERDLHDAFHRGLRRMWEATSGRQGDSGPAPGRATRTSTTRRRHERS
jgi:hypothetical protein